LFPSFFSPRPRRRAWRTPAWGPSRLPRWGPRSCFGNPPRSSYPRPGCREACASMSASTGSIL